MGLLFLQMKILQVAILAITCYQVALPLEEGEYFCGETTTVLKVQWQPSDPAKAKAYVRYHSQDQSCTKTLNGPGETITVEYGKCGIDSVVPNQNNQSIDVMVVTTVLSSGVLSSSADKIYQYQCQFKQGKPYADVSKSTVINPRTVLTSGTAGNVQVVLDILDEKLVVVTDVNAGSLVIAQMKFNDSQKLYKGNGIITDITYSVDPARHLSAVPIEVIKDGCSTGNDGSTRDVAQQTGLHIKGVTYIKSTKMKALLFDVDTHTQVTVHVRVVLCAALNDQRCQPVDCNAQRAAGRRRRDAEKGFDVAFASTPLTIRKAPTKPSNAKDPVTTTPTLTSVYTIIITTLAALVLIASLLVYVVNKRMQRTNRDTCHVVPNDKHINQ